MADALEGLGLAGFGFGKEEGGKCFCLYASCTPSSSCDLPSAYCAYGVGWHMWVGRRTNFECSAVMLYTVS